MQDNANPTPTSTPTFNDPKALAAQVRVAMDESAVATGDQTRRLDVIRLWHRIDAGRQELARLFGAQYGWKRTLAHFSIEQLRDRKFSNKSRTNYHRAPFPLIDHEYWYRDAQGRAAALAFHSYNVERPGTVDQAARAKLAQEYAALGLRCTYPDFPAWWYPGAATLVLVEPGA